MTKNSKQNEVDELDGLEIDYDGDVTGRLGYESARWSYTGIGPNFKRNTFYINDQEVKSLNVIPLAVRQYKQVALGDDKVTRLSMYSKDGDPRMQLLLVLAEDPTKIYCLGTGAYTGRASFFNTGKDGSWHNPDMPIGIMVALRKHIDLVANKKGVQTPYNAWQFEISFSEEEVTVGSGRNAQQVHTIVHSPFKYVGKELAKQLDELYEREDLNGWIKQYENGDNEVLENAGNGAVAESMEVVDYSEFTESDEIPF